MINSLIFCPSSAINFHLLPRPQTANDDFVCSQRKLLKLYVFLGSFHAILFKKYLFIGTCFIKRGKQHYTLMFYLFSSY